MVTQVKVTSQYQFPQAELSAMAYNMAQLIQDIDKLDNFRKSMMGEPKQLRDITLFYDKLYPDLHITRQNACGPGVSLYLLHEDTAHP